jgi:outer membrane protein assembly factor BamB
MINQARRKNGRLIGSVIIAAVVILAGIVTSNYLGGSVRLGRTSTTNPAVTNFSTSRTNTILPLTENGSCAAGAAYKDEWLTFKHDSQRTGFSSSNFSSPEGRFLGQLAWQSKFAGISEMVSAKHMLFAAEYELNALNSSNGALLWSIQSGAGPYPPLSSDGKLVYLGSNLGGLVAFEPASGHNMLASGQVLTLGAAAICGDVAYVSSGPGGMGYPQTPTGSLLSLNLTTGTTLWNVSLKEGSFIGYPTTDGRLVYSVVNNDTVVAFASNSGALVWKEVLPQASQTVTAPGNVTISSASSSTVTGPRTVTVTLFGGQNIVETPPLAGGKLFVTTMDGHVFALNATNGNRVWTAALGAPVDDPRSSSAVGYGKIFLGTSGGLYALNASDGSVAWKARLADKDPGTPTVVGGSVFVADRNGTLYQFDADKGSLLWHFSGLGGGYVGEPIVADGLLVMDVNSGVFAFR